jgi:hypothetical protein
VFAEDKEMQDAAIAAAAAAADDADRMSDVEKPAEAAAQTKRKKRAGTPVAKIAEEDKPKVEPLRPPAKRVNALNPLEEVCCGNGHLIYNTSGGVDVYANYQPGCAICGAGVIAPNGCSSTAYSCANQSCRDENKLRTWFCVNCVGTYGQNNLGFVQRIVNAHTTSEMYTNELLKSLREKVMPTLNDTDSKMVKPLTLEVLDELQEKYTDDVTVQMDLQTLKGIADEFLHPEIEIGNLQYEISLYDKDIAEKLKQIENIKKAIGSNKQRMAMRKKKIDLLQKRKAAPG